MFLEEISDDYLVCLYFEKNQDAIDLLFERYTKFIYGIIRDYCKQNEGYIDFEDVFNDCFLAFLVCIERYDQDKGNFYFYVRKAVERKIIDRFEEINKNKMIVSLDSFRYDEGKETYLDFIAEENAFFEEKSDLKEELYDCLDDYDKTIVDLKIEGYSYQEIAKILKSTKQSVYRRVSKIKNILKDIIEKID